MNWEKFISNRFYDSSKNQGWYSGLFSMIGMGVGCFAMIISLSVMKGFETLVHGKLKGFVSGARNWDSAISKHMFSDLID